jgi:predicted Zn-ribbon and HTH transcriptional regulator
MFAFESLPGCFRICLYSRMSEQLDRLLLEWHPKNEKSLGDYAKSSKVKVWWKCRDCSHEWTATIGNRIGRNSKCPKCRTFKSRGNTNPRWTGFGEISGRQWNSIQQEARPTLDFTITIEYIWKLFLEQDKKCALSGEPLTMWGMINGQLSGNSSLDRINSSKGYVPGNVQWIDKKLQHVKTKLTDEEFISICQKVAAHQAQKIWNGNTPPSFKEWTRKSDGKGL